MSFKKILGRQCPDLYSLFGLFLCLSFLIISCTDSGGGSISFPPPKSDIWCTYNVSFNEGTSPNEIDKQKEQMASDVRNNVRSTEDGIQCDPNTNWVRIDDLHWQLEVTVHCFRLSDTSTVRPPTGTKPPPARVIEGTVYKSGCPDDEIKK